LQREEQGVRRVGLQLIANVRRHVMVNIKSPVWNLSQACPSCGQGSSLVLIVCPNCSHVAIECDEEGIFFSDVLQLGFGNQTYQRSDHCPVCDGVAFEEFEIASDVQIQLAGIGPELLG
jgi:hypothetical protein